MDLEATACVHSLVYSLQYSKSVFESINSIRHNDIARKAIPHVYDTITEKNIPQFVSTSLYE